MVILTSKTNKLKLPHNAVDFDHTAAAAAAVPCLACGSSFFLAVARKHALVNDGDASAQKRARRLSEQIRELIIIYQSV